MDPKLSDGISGLEDQVIPPILCFPTTDIFKFQSLLHVHIKETIKLSSTAENRRTKEK